MLQVFYSFLYGIIEGITEWLPISSTGHLILFEQAVGWTNNEAMATFLEMFRVVIQLGAIMAVVLLYWNKLWPFSKKKTLKQRNGTLRMWALVIVGCLPAAVIGLLLDDPINDIFYNHPTVAITLVLYGVLFIVVENLIKQGKIQTTRETFGRLDIKTAALIGAFQVLALIPGTSRSGVTILGAIILGCSRSLAAEYSFFLSIPVMVGASLLKCVKLGAEMIGKGTTFTATEVWMLIVGILTAFIVSVIAIKFLINFIKKHDFKPFGYYRIALGIIVLIVYIFTI